MAERAIFERDKKRSFSGEQRSHQRPYSRLCLILREDRRRNEEKKEQRRAAKRSNLFPFSLSREQSTDDALLSFVQRSFSGYPVRRLLACETGKLSFYVVVLQIHVCIKLTASVDFMIVLRRAGGKGKSFGLKLHRYELVVPLQRIHRPESLSVDANGR